jgi:hypothetical protein
MALDDDKLRRFDEAFADHAQWVERTCRRVYENGIEVIWECMDELPDDVSYYWLTPVLIAARVGDQYKHEKQIRELIAGMN